MEMLNVLLKVAMILSAAMVKEMFVCGKWLLT